MPELFTDNYETTLAAAIATTARPSNLTVSVTNGDLTSGDFAAIIEPDTPNAERIKVTAVTGPSYTFETEPGSTARTHPTGSVFRHALTARSFKRPLADHVADPDPHTQYLRKSVWSAIGDLVVGISGGLTRFAVGADGTVLTADSSTPSGLAWKATGGSVLSAVGDLLTVLVSGAARLPAGAIGQFLQVVQNASVLANPGAAPTLSAGTGTPTWAASTAYLIGYAWGNASGQTLLSPTVTYNSGGTPSPQTVTCPAAPSGATFLYVYVGLISTAMHLVATVASPSTSSQNLVNVTGPNVAGAAPNSANTTGGLGPAWVSPTNFAPSGLTGATAASRYAGATTGGAPTSGTWSVGDLIVDQTGKVWICTVAGAPGIWKQTGGGTATALYLASTCI